MYLNTHAGNSDASQKPLVLERKDTGRTEWTFGLATVIKQENIIFFFFYILISLHSCHHMTPGLLVENVFYFTFLLWLF